MIQSLGMQLIQEASLKQAQDIYLIPQKDSYQVFMRVGDSRQKIGDYEWKDATNLISHFKFVSGMNVGEKRRTQLGSCDYHIDQQGLVSLRLSTVGDYRGHESLVIRLLATQESQLHYWFDSFERIEKAIHGRGLYLFAGPVGSGKTRLMYALMEKYMRDSQIITIEDPVEIKQDAILQLQVNNSIGMTYDNLIKLSLRHRPDLVIIGEIRDTETAQAVIRASLTGAMVFSTIHAKSIPGVFSRLIELGVKRDELLNCLNLIAYQRLIAGGGLIDFATEKFEEHTHNQWNQEVEQLLKQGYIDNEKAKLEKIKG
ncbi:competence type IV pilus ATPase ComGA [Streptococcus uberis]|uniref:competence type IV pilus ATPase ComGA n=1 Tax=Streptococcus uberis TaxID=1349 RepID=UPI00062043AA|nr:competence type IV pilus ATPase ComGA [Streptococcus uberis]KKF45479.1 competence protein CglA [Streptococcus uberis Ab71]KKF57357.1 competence protein CglA [Streptococcus uberis 6780]MCK1230129.1 Flp pilus assembly complex ATPase component TadA [Streptococcus uberis]MEE3738659.1 competence type IV pilus ATPase ComGA [Streptococcus uberis]MTB99541.1 type II/IV secretion system protein [Streptococcus uberis]